MVRRRRKFKPKEIAGAITLGNVALLSIVGFAGGGLLGAGIGATLGSATNIPLRAGAKQLKRERRRKGRRR